MDTIELFEAPPRHVAPVAQENTLTFRVSLEDRIEKCIATVMQLIAKGHALAITLSAGKDSTTTTLLCLEAIRRTKALGLAQATHYISSSSTSVENPEIEAMLLTAHENISRWAATYDLPLEVRLVEPNAATRFVVNIIGRGTLPRFVENGNKRTCSADWKVKPQQRLVKQIQEEALGHGFKESITILGLRLDESQVRGAAMARRNDQQHTPVRNPMGFLTLSLIADWLESDVWDFLTSFLASEVAPFPAYAQGETIRRMLDVYRDSNEGTCGMFMSDGKKAPCGSRHGCWTCTITGDKDKSMESLLNSDAKYAYMRGLSQFRNFLIASQWDMSRRELVGRSVSTAGMIPVRPDVYNLQMRKQMLGYLLTLDVLEAERAEALDADLQTGKAPRTPENMRMAEPQFQTVSERDLPLIDFHWSMHHYASCAFPAVQLWYEVKVLGRRFPIPSLEKFAKDDGIPLKKWFPVGALDRDAPSDGLRSYMAELWNPYLHPERSVTYGDASGQKIVWHEDAETLEVSAPDAILFIDSYCHGQLPIQTQHFPAIESARFWLNEGIIKLPKGMAAKYNNMAIRGQYFANLIERMNITPDELDVYLVENSISDAQHNLLIGDVPQEEDAQFSLFED